MYANHREGQYEHDMQMMCKQHANHIYVYIYVYMYMQRQGQYECRAITPVPLQYSFMCLRHVRGVGSPKANECKAIAQEVVCS